MTPAVAHCTIRCLFSWRIQSNDLHVAVDEAVMTDWDPPDVIGEGALRAQQRILTGYKAHKKRDEQRYREALHPNHAAISLAGEPALYPELGELVKEFHRQDFATFIVTNGTVLKALQELSAEPPALCLLVGSQRRGLQTSMPPTGAEGMVQGNPVPPVTLKFHVSNCPQADPRSPHADDERGRLRPAHHRCSANLRGGESLRLRRPIPASTALRKHADPSRHQRL
jgi:hypothetical protein